MKLHWAFLVKLSDDQPMKISVFCDSSVYLGILGQPFPPIFPHFSSFFLKLKNQDHFSKSLKNLKNNTDISYNSFIIT